MVLLRGEGSSWPQGHKHMMRPRGTYGCYRPCLTPNVKALGWACLEYLPGASMWLVWPSEDGNNHQVLLLGQFEPDVSSITSLEYKISICQGAWVAQSVKLLTSAQVVISRCSWVQAPYRALCWQLGAWSLLRILCLPLSLPFPAPAHTLSSPSLSLSKRKKKKKRIWNLNEWPFRLL